MTQTLTELVDTYIAAWNETDPDKRLTLLAGVWADNGIYEDANIKTVGRKDLSDYIGAFQNQTHGARLSLCGTPLNHHDYAFFVWKMAMGPQGAADEITGYDFVTIDKQGLFARIVGFL